MDIFSGFSPSPEAEMQYWRARHDAKQVSESVEGPLPEEEHNPDDWDYDGWEDSDWEKEDQ